MQEKKNILLGECITLTFVLVFMVGLTTPTDTPPATPKTLSPDTQIAGELRIEQNVEGGVLLVEKSQVDDRERELDIELFTTEMQDFQLFERQLREKDDTVELTNDKKTKEKFQRILLKIMDEYEHCSLGNLSRNRFLSHFIKFLRKQKLIHQRSELGLERSLLIQNSGHGFWDQFEDEFVREMVLPLFSSEDQDKGSKNMQSILEHLDEVFVKQVIDDETERGLAQAKDQTSPLIVKLKKNLVRFCSEDYQARRLGKLGYWGFIAEGLSQQLNKDKDLSLYNLAEKSTAILRGLQKNKLLKDTDFSFFQSDINTMINEDIESKKNKKSEMSDFKKKFLDFLNAEEGNETEERKLLMTKDKKLDSSAFEERLRKMAESRYELESNMTLVSEFERYSQRSSSEETVRSIRRQLTNFFKKMGTLGKVAHHQELQIKNLTRSVLLDSFLAGKFDQKRFFDELKDRLRDKNRKHVVEAIFLNFLKNSEGQENLKKMVSNLADFEDSIGTRFDTLGKSLVKMGLTTDEELNEMKARVLYDFKINLNSDVGLDRELSNFRELRLVTTSAVTTGPIATNPRMLKKCRRIIGKSRQHSISLKEGFIFMIVKRFFDQHGSETFTDYGELERVIKVFLHTLIKENIIQINQITILTEKIMSIVVKYLVKGKFQVKVFESKYKVYTTEMSRKNERFRLGNIILNTGEGGLSQEDILTVKQKLEKYEIKYHFKLSDLILQYREEMPKEEDTQAIYEKIAAKLKSLQGATQQHIIFMLQELFSLASSINFSHVAKLRTFLESFFAQFSTISQGDRQEWMTLIIKLVVPRIAAIEKVTDEDILAKFNEKFPGVMDSMDEEAKVFIRMMLVKYIKLLLTSEEKELQFYKDRLVEFIQDEGQLNKFMGKLEQIQGKHKLVHTSEELNALLVKLKDFFMKDEKYKIIFKIYLQMVLPNDRLTKEQLEINSKKIRDFEIEQPDMANLFKTLTNIKGDKIATTVESIHAIIRKIMDQASVEVKIRSFLMKISTQMTQLTSGAKEELNNIANKLRDYFMTIENYRKFITALGYMKKHKVINLTKEELDIIHKNLQDFEHENPDVGFLIKLLLKINENFSEKDLDTVIATWKRIQDKEIKIEGSFKFLLKKLQQSTKVADAHRKEKVGHVLKKLRDYLIKVDTFSKYVFGILITQSFPNYSLLLQQMQVFERKIRDMEIQFPEMSHLLKLLFIMKGKNIESRFDEIQLALRKVVDKPVQIDQKLKFLMKIILGIKSIDDKQSKQKVEMNLRKIRDFFLKVDPYIQYIISLKIVQKKNAMTLLKSELKLNFRIIRDFLVELPYLGYLLKSLFSIKGKMSVADIQRIAIAMKMVQDFHIKVDVKLKYLFKKFLKISKIGGMKETQSLALNLKKYADQRVEIDYDRLVLWSQSSLDSTNIVSNKMEVSLLNKKIKDYFIALKLMSFLIKSLAKIRNVNGYKETSHFSSFLQLIRDHLFTLQSPAVLYKYLIRMQKTVNTRSKNVLKMMLSGLKDYLVINTNYSFLITQDYKQSFPKIVSKLGKFKMFMKKIKDYFNSPDTLQIFLIKSRLFNMKEQSVKSLMKFKMARKIMRDNYILVEPSFRKFLMVNLLKFFHGMKFSSVQKFKLVLRKFVDALNIPQAQNKVLYKSIVSLYRPSLSSSITLKNNFLVRRVRDYMIHIQSNKKFLIKGWYQNKKFVKIQKLMKLRMYWRKMRDFLNSPLNLQQFVLLSLMMSRKQMTANESLRIKALLSKTQDFRNLIDPNFSKFLLSSFFNFFGEFRVGTFSKMKFMLKRFIDAFIMTGSEKKFLLKLFITQLTHSPYLEQKLKYNLFMRKIKDYLIHIGGHSFLMKSRLIGQSTYPKITQKLLQLRLFWTKLKDFFISPDRMDMFLLKTLLFKSSTNQITIALKNTFIIKKLKDYLNLVEPGFRIFLLRSLYHMSLPYQFYNMTKLNFFLQKFVDALNLPGHQNKFLLKALTSTMRGGLSSSGKLRFRFVFKHLLDNLNEVERNDIFLIKSRIDGQFDIKKTQMEKLRLGLKRFKDFFISPMSTDKFILSSLILSNKKYTKKELMGFKFLLAKFKDLHVLVSIDFRKFLLTSLFHLFRSLKFYSKVKLRFALKRYVDHFLFPESTRKFLLEMLMNLVGVGFISHSKLNMRGVFAKLRDWKVDVTVPGKYLLKFDMGIRNQYLKSSLVKFKAFLTRMHDYLIHPIRLNQFLIQMIAQGQADFAIKHFMSFRAKFAKIKDFMIYPEKYLAFLLDYVVRMSKDFRFSSKAKVKIFLKKILDYVIHPQAQKKFLIKMLMVNLDGGLKVHQKIRLNLRMSRFLDRFITIHGRDFIVRSRFFRRIQSGGFHIAKLRGQLKRMRDFFISPDTLQQYIIKSLLSQSASVKVVKKMFAKMYYRQVNDCHILIDPQQVIFVLMAISKIFPKFQITSVAQLRFLFKRYLDYFLIPRPQAKFLVKLMARLYRKSYNRRVVKLKGFLFHFVDRYIAIQPNTAFIKLEQRSTQFAHAIARLKMRAKINALRDYRIDVNNKLSFFLFSYLKAHKKDAVQFFTKIKALWSRIRDRFIEIKTRQFIMKMLYYKTNTNTIRKINKIKAFLSRYRDYRILTYRLNLFLMKLYVTYFGDLKYVSHTAFKAFLRKFIDNFIDVFHKNLMNFILMEYTKPAFFKNGQFQVQKLFKKLRLGKSISIKSKVNQLQEHMVKLSLLQAKWRKIQHLFAKKKTKLNFQTIRKANMFMDLLHKEHAKIEKKIKLNDYTRKSRLKFIDFKIRKLNALLEKQMKIGVMQKIGLSTNSKMSKRRMKFLRRQIRNVNLASVIKNNGGYVNDIENNIRARMYHLRTKMLKRGFGWNAGETTKFASKENLEKIEFKGLFSRKNIKVFYRYRANQIMKTMKDSQTPLKHQDASMVTLGKYRLKFKIHPDSFEYTKTTKKAPLSSIKKSNPDNNSKMKLKTFIPEKTQMGSGKEFQIYRFYKKMRHFDQVLSAIKFKMLNFESGNGTDEAKHIAGLRQKLKSMDSNFSKMVLKPLKFEIFPNLTRNYAQAFSKKAVGISLKSFQKKLAGVKKIFLRKIARPRRKPGDSYKPNAKMNKRIKKLYRAMNHMKDYFSAKKVFLMSVAKPGNKVTDVAPEFVKAVYSKVNKMLKNVDFHGNLNGVEKLILKSINKPGNKETDKEVKYLKLNGGLRKHSSYSQKRFENMVGNAKVLLDSVNKPGNKETDKETQIKRFIARIFRRNYGMDKKKLDYESFRKIFVKFYQHIGAPKNYSKAFKIIENALNLKAHKQGLATFKKVLLESINRPGNKETDHEPKPFTLRSQNDILLSFKTLGKKLESTQKVLLKSQDLPERECECPECCCEFLVFHSTGEESAEEEAEEAHEIFSKENVIDTKHEIEMETEKELLRSIARGDAEDVASISQKKVFQILGLDESDEYAQGWDDLESPGHVYLQHQAETLLENLGEKDLDCSAKKHKIFNILPDVHFNMRLKNEYQPELTTTSDIPKITQSNRRKSDDLLQRFNDEFEKDKDPSLEPPKWMKENPRENKPAPPMDGHSDEEVELMRDLDRFHPNFHSILMKGDDFMGKDFHEEHHMSKVERKPVLLKVDRDDTIDML